MFTDESSFKNHGNVNVRTCITGPWKIPTGSARLLINDSGVSMFDAESMTLFLSGKLNGTVICVISARQFSPSQETWDRKLEYQCDSSMMGASHTSHVSAEM